MSTTMKPGYSLRVPFSLSPGHEINDLTAPVVQRAESHTVRLAKNIPGYVLTVEDIGSEQEARQFINNVWAALSWVMVDRGLGFTASMEIDDVHYPDNPSTLAENLSASFKIPIVGEVDGLADGRQPIVFQTQKKMRLMSLGDASVTIGLPARGFMSNFEKGLQLPGCAKVYDNSKLRTALELYSAFYYEHSANAKLLTLVMALETLTADLKKAPIAQELISKWRKQIQTLKTKHINDPVDLEALEALERELIFREDASLKSKLKKMVTDALAEEGPVKAKEYQRRVGKVYDKRSILVHKGTLPTKELEEAQADAKAILEAVLKTKLKGGARD